MSRVLLKLDLCADDVVLDTLVLCHFPVRDDERLLVLGFVVIVVVVVGTGFGVVAGEGTEGWRGFAEGRREGFSLETVEDGVELGELTMVESKATVTASDDVLKELTR
jgi:hypothetical protein